MGSENLRFAQALGKDVFRIFHNIVALEIKLSLLPLDRKNQQLPKWIKKSPPTLKNKVGLPAVGIEPTLRKKRDFESLASANSATPATEAHNL